MENGVEILYPIKKTILRCRSVNHQRAATPQQSSIVFFMGCCPIGGDIF